LSVYHSQSEKIVNNLILGIIRFAGEEL